MTSDDIIGPPDGRQVPRFARLPYLQGLENGAAYQLR
jgi:hypothetical protein